MQSKQLVDSTVANNTVGAVQAEIVRALDEGVFVEVRFNDVPAGVTGKLAFVGTIYNDTVTALTSSSSKLMFKNHATNNYSNFIFIDSTLDGKSMILKIDELPLTKLTYYLYEATAGTIDLNILVKWE